MNSILLRILALLIQLCFGSHGAFKSCYDCKIDSNGENYMCNFGGLSVDPWKYTCCSPDNPSDYCKKSDFNECYPSYNQVKERFYTYCPLVNNTMCGTESEDHSLIATNEPQTFSFNKLRLKYKWFKLP